MQRIQKIRSILEEKQIDAILIKSRSNNRKRRQGAGDKR